MKQILSIIILLATSLGVAAQTFVNSPDRPARFAERIPLDSSYMECVYQYNVHDPVLDKDEEDFKFLEIGRRISKYSDYANFQLDSVIAIDYPNGMSRNQYHQLSRNYSNSLEATIKEFETGTIKTYDKVFIDRYVYEEPLKLMDWTLQPGSKDICGQTCRKATTSFRGRNWTAWYAPDIPIDNGPWKFGGLPGLILKVESNDGEQRFEATAIRNNPHTISLAKLRYQKTTREKYNNDLKEYMTRPPQFHIANPTMAPKDKDGNIATPQFRRLFFNPIELE